MPFSDLEFFNFFSEHAIVKKVYELRLRTRSFFEKSYKFVVLVCIPFFFRKKLRVRGLSSYTFFFEKSYEFAVLVRIPFFFFRKKLWVRGISSYTFFFFRKKIKILNWDPYPFLILIYALPQHQLWLNTNVFLNINTVFTYSTKKKDLIRKWWWYELNRPTFSKSLLTYVCISYWFLPCRFFIVLRSYLCRIIDICT